ncbi:hypothetical protein Tco_1040333, partial [Tanacetum coccineum]
MAESEKRSPQQPPQAHTDHGFRTVVKAFGQSLESLRPAIVVAGTNIIRFGFRGGVEIVAALHGRFIDM